MPHEMTCVTATSASSLEGAEHGMRNQVVQSTHVDAPTKLDLDVAGSRPQLYLRVEIKGSE